MNISNVLLLDVDKKSLLDTFAIGFSYPLAPCRTSITLLPYEPITI